MISNLNKHRFEYIWHLYYSNKSYEDLPFHEHKQADPSVWQMPEKFNDYYHLIFGLGKESFHGKTVLDVGCGVAWYLGFLENSVKKYIGVDPDVKSIKYAKIMAKIVDVDSDISVDSAENLKCKADTIMMLSVTHRIPNVKHIFEKFDCENIILDSWEKLPGIDLYTLIEYLGTKGFYLKEKHKWIHSSTDDQKLGNRYILHFNRQK